MEILVEVPQEILDGIARGEYIRKGGVVVTKEGHKVIAWLKETVATGSNIPVIEYLDDYEVPYLEFGNFMADFENNSEATVCLPKISVHHN